VTLFVSSDLLNSDYRYEKEMIRAMEGHASAHFQSCRLSAM
jgi:hypothetical protein